MFGNCMIIHSHISHDAIHIAALKLAENNINKTAECCLGYELKWSMQALASQGVICRQVTLTSPRNLLEVQTLRSTSNLLGQN